MAFWNGCGSSEASGGSNEKDAPSFDNDYGMNRKKDFLFIPVMPRFMIRSTSSELNRAG